MTLLDEFASEVAPISAPDFAGEFGLSVGVASGLAIAAYASLALFVEAPLLAWAERGRVAFVSASALATLALAMLLVASAPSAAVLLVALALYGPASGVALAASEGTLVEARPAERERTLARLTLAGIAGDALVPVLLIALAPAGFGWRAVAVLAAGAALALAWRHLRSRALDRPFASGVEDEPSELEPRPPLRELAHVVRNHPSLIGWSFVAAIAGLLDESLVAFASAHLAEFTGATRAQRLLALSAWTLGDLAGVLALQAALARVGPLQILRAAAALAGAALAAFLVTRSIVVAALALGVIGASAITFHPLLMARAYAALPGRPALVGACGALLAPTSLIAPLALAGLAGAHGTWAAISALAIVPVIVGIAALRTRAG